MRKVAIFSALLVICLVLSQMLPRLLGNQFESVANVVRILTTIGLGFIMIHVGYEFEIDKRNPGKYAWDYLVAATAAGFPWIFCAFYFVFAMVPAVGWNSWDVWKETLLAARFASPTSAGVLFSMLAAAGLSATWLFGKARVLAIFDDLDTVLFMIPLQVAMVGFRWQLIVILMIVAGLLWAAWRYLHEIALPVTWKWVLGFSIGMTLLIELLYEGSKFLDQTLPIHVEILLPAFVLGCIMSRPPGGNPHADDAIEGHQEGPESPSEQRASTVVAACFMCLVGLSMPQFMTEATQFPAESAHTALATLVAPMGWGIIALHVAAITIISNLGKMFPTFCYRQEAGWRERIALGVGLWPRGEVGGGVLVLSLSYGIGGPVMLVAMLSLALNLLLTGVFILIIRRLINPIYSSAHR